MRVVVSFLHHDHYGSPSSINQEEKSQNLAICSWRAGRRFQLWLERWPNWPRDESTWQQGGGRGDRWSSWDTEAKSCDTVEDCCTSSGDSFIQRTKNCSGQYYRVCDVFMPVNPKDHRHFMSSYRQRTESRSPRHKGEMRVQGPGKDIISFVCIFFLDMVQLSISGAIKLRCHTRGWQQ